MLYAVMLNFIVLTDSLRSMYFKCTFCLTYLVSTQFFFIISSLLALGNVSGGDITNCDAYNVYIIIIVKKLIGRAYNLCISTANFLLQ